MKKAKILSGVLLLCFSSPLISQAATLDVHGGYHSGSHTCETRLEVNEGWQNGWWASMESSAWNTIHDNKKENTVLNNVQVEVSYAIKLDDQWTVHPGMLTHFGSNGTRYGPYVKLSQDTTKDLKFGIHCRYDWKAYRQRDLSGDTSRDNVHRWDGYVTYHISNDFTFAW